MADSFRDAIWQAGRRLRGRRPRTANSRFVRTAVWVKVEDVPDGSVRRLGGANLEVGSVDPQTGNLSWHSRLSPSGLILCHTMAQSARRVKRPTGRLGATCAAHPKKRFKQCVSVRYVLSWRVLIGVSDWILATAAKRAPACHRGRAPHDRTGSLASDDKQARVDDLRPTIRPNDRRQRLFGAAPESTSRVPDKSPTNGHKNRAA
jgi:hypothetical protein